MPLTVEQDLLGSGQCVTLRSKTQPLQTWRPWQFHKYIDVLPWNWHAFPSVVDNRDAVWPGIPVFRREGETTVYRTSRIKRGVTLSFAISSSVQERLRLPIVPHDSTADRLSCRKRFNSVGSKSDYVTNQVTSGTFEVFESRIKLHKVYINKRHTFMSFVDYFRPLHETHEIQINDVTKFSNQFSHCRFLCYSTLQMLR